MKIFYTTDGSIDQQLQQVCPFGELHHFKRDDGSEFTIKKYVGCGGCEKCQYCYGAGSRVPYGPKLSSFSLIPKVFSLNPYNYEEDEKEKSKLGLKQFEFISDNDYIRCAKCYTNINNILKFKIWWWHHIGIKFRDIQYFVNKKFWDFKFKVDDIFYKWFKKKNVECGK